MSEAGPSRTTDASGDVSMEDDTHQYTYNDYPSPPLPEGLTINPDDPDDEDEIAHTLPIYISHNLSPSVHLFQYPVHQRKIEVSSYGQQRAQVITARMKENVGRFELEVPVDLRESHWNEDRAEELGFLPVEESKNEKGKGKRKDDKPENWGTKMRLRSEEVPNVTGYWTGIVQKGETRAYFNGRLKLSPHVALVGALHLHPVDKLLQLRPSLAYLDALETANRLEKEREARAKGDGDDDEEEDDGMDGADAAKNKVKQEEFRTVQVSSRIFSQPTFRSGR